LQDRARAYREILQNPITSQVSNLTVNRLDFPILLAFGALDPKITVRIRANCEDIHVDHPGWEVTPRVGDPIEGKAIQSQLERRGNSSPTHFSKALSRFLHGEGLGIQKLDLLRSKLVWAKQAELLIKKIINPFYSI
jgi:hypothetical protein